MISVEQDDEQWVIDQICRRVPGAAPLGIGDDGAVPPPGAGTPVLSTDTMVEGVHWDGRLSAEDVGWKLVAVNVSDLGAMGAVPSWALLNLSLPAPLDRAWAEGFVTGLAAACRRWDLQLIGGDTTRGPARFAVLTVGGYARRAVRRSGGRPGDGVWMTGEAGRAAEGFLAAAPRPAALAWLRRPEPPVRFGAAVAGIAGAMMDLSDGLCRDLRRLCAASGCGAEIEADKIPGDRALNWKTSFGEDYELLLTVPPERENELRSLAELERIDLSRIGVLTEGGAVRLKNSGLSGAGWPSPLFEHFPTTIRTPGGA